MKTPFKVLWGPREAATSKVVLSKARFKGISAMFEENGDDEDFEFSPLSGPFTEDGITVNVMIYRKWEMSDGWTLEIAVDDETSVEFDYSFSTDVEARAEFEAIVRENGLADVIDVPERDARLN